MIPHCCTMNENCVYMLNNKNIQIKKKVYLLKTIIHVNAWSKKRYRTDMLSCYPNEWNRHVVLPPKEMERNGHSLRSKIQDFRKGKDHCHVILCIRESKTTGKYRV